MNHLWKLAVLAVVVAGAIWWACSREANTEKVDNGSGAASATSAPLPGYPPAPRMPLLSPEETYHGMAWAVHHSYHSVELADKLLGEIADLGADTVLISNAAVQEHAGSASFEIDPERTPSPPQWQRIFQIAHDNGLRVILMPMILLEHPRGTEWRGQISPPNWDDWLEQYREFILHFARIAAEGEVEVFMVGSELVSAEQFTDHWRRLISDVREVFPGKLSYSANWDHYKGIAFWDLLDLVGMTSYYKLSPDPNPSLDLLIEEWASIKAGLLRWQHRIGKPLLFTEVGWCSQEGASIYPWDYYHNQKATPAALEEQRRCYVAFMRTWEDTPEVGGALWWEWTHTGGGPGDFNYTPRGKPAEPELRNWFARIRARRGPAMTSGPAP